MPTNPRRSSAATLSLAGATIVVSPSAPAMTRLAAAELGRYLVQLTRKVSPLAARLPAKGVAVVLDPGLAASLGVKVTRRS